MKNFVTNVNKKKQEKEKTYVCKYVYVKQINKYKK